MDDLQTVARWIASEGPAVAFTGAGISTESGIPDFRSPGGVWSRRQPVEYHLFLSSPAARYEYWDQKCEAHADFANAKPNDGHRALAEWEWSGKLKAVVTQNIDGLHQDAGSVNVLELHGTARFVSCLSCSVRYPAQDMVDLFQRTKVVPVCDACGGMLKHATISFGQDLPQDALEESARLMKEASVVLAIGSSLVVQPAASLPRIAERYGAHLVIINRDPTPLDGIADIVIRQPIGPTLSKIHSLMEAEKLR